ncbi:hypothetical protein APED_20555 [Acanthopleuribacter pedis]
MFPIDTLRQSPQATASMIRGFLLTLFVLSLSGCHKYFDVENETVPGNTLVLEFSTQVKYVMTLKINGKEIPVKYSGNNRVLTIEGLPEGTHNFNVNSISYVFGPEFDSFKVTPDRGAYFFVQARKYRSGLPKNRAQVSIRAYRRSLKQQGIDPEAPTEGAIVARFR